MRLDSNQPCAYAAASFNLGVCFWKAQDRQPKAMVKKPSKIHIIFVTFHDHFELIYPTDAISRNDMIQTWPNSNQEFQETEKRRNQATHHLCSSETKQMLFFMLPGYHKTMPINITAITQLSTVSYNIKVAVLHCPILTSFYFILWFFFFSLLRF